MNVLSQQPPAQYFLRTIFTRLVVFPASQILGTGKVGNNKERKWGKDRRQRAKQKSSIMSVLVFSIKNVSAGFDKEWVSSTFFFSLLLMTRLHFFKLFKCELILSL